MMIVAITQEPALNPSVACALEAAGRGICIFFGLSLVPTSFVVQLDRFYGFLGRLTTTASTQDFRSIIQKIY